MMFQFDQDKNPFSNMDLDRYNKELRGIKAARLNIKWLVENIPPELVKSMGPQVIKVEIKFLIDTVRPLAT